MAGFGNLVDQVNHIFSSSFMRLNRMKKQEIYFGSTSMKLTEKQVENDLAIPSVEKTKNLELTYPYLDGIWSTILALPKS